MAPLAYSPDIERPEPDEQASIDGIIAGMIAQSRTAAAREGRVVRASHAKITACAVGRFEVVDGLPPELAQGLFAAPGASYGAAVRFAQGPGELLNDRVATHRGLSIKVFGVEGEPLAPHAARTQDFVLATGTTFPSGTARGFLRDGTVIGKATGLPEIAKSAVSSVARNINELLHVFGAASPMADFLGRPYDHPFADPYYSQAPIRFGEHVAKLGAFPATPAQLALRDRWLAPKGDPDMFAHAAVSFLAEHEVVYEIRAQLWTDAATQPIEDSSVDWPVATSPYRTVATLRLPVQDAASAARQRYFDEVMTFRPGHTLAAHRPLGSVMRARLQVYRALSEFRHRETGVAAAEPSDAGEIPA